MPPGQPVQPQPYPQQPYPQQPSPQQPPQPYPGQPYPQQPYPQQPYPQQPYPQQPYPQQPAPPQGAPGTEQQPGYGNGQPGYPPGGAPQPGYGPAAPPQPGYGPGYGPPPPPPPKESTCCRVAIRFDPFELLFRRLSFQGEVAIIGPLALEVEPSWIFGSGAENVNAKGFAIAGNVAFYLTGKAPQGFFIKAHAAYETFRATVTNPGYSKSLGSGQISSPIFGGMIGSSNVFGKNWGFNLSGGIGIGVATAGSQTVVAPGKGSIAPYAVRFYDKGSSIQLLGSLGLGIAF